MTSSLLSLYSSNVSFLYCLLCIILKRAHVECPSQISSYRWQTDLITRSKITSNNFSENASQESKRIRTLSLKVEAEHDPWLLAVQAHSSALLGLLMSSDGLHVDKLRGASKIWTESFKSTTKHISFPIRHPLPYPGFDVCIFSSCRSRLWATL